MSSLLLYLFIEPKTQRSESVFEVLPSNQFSIALVKGYSTDLLVEIIKGIKDDIFAKVALKLGEGGPVCLLIGDWGCFLLVICT